MMNNTTAISVSANFDMTSLLSALKNSNATVIIINNNGTPIDMNNVFDTTATEVKKTRTFNLHKYYEGKVRRVLNDHDIQIKVGKGCKRGHISAGAFDELVNQLETKEVTLRRVKFLFNALDEAGYKEEGRGLKKDVLFETLSYIKENNLAVTYKGKGENSHSRGNAVKERYELDNLVEKLSKIPFTNDFAIKFANCLREDEVAYTTFKMA
jgi:hypothetical protein